MVIVNLYHGRHSKEEDLNDWGFQGPVLGPFQAVHITYLSRFQCLLPDWSDQILGFDEEYVVFAGCFYGDFTIQSLEGIKRLEGQKDLFLSNMLEKTNRILTVKEEELPLMIEEAQNEPGLLSILEYRLKGKDPWEG